MFEVCAYYTNSVSRNDFEHYRRALNCASQICNDEKAHSVEINDTKTGTTLIEFFPEV